MRAYALGQDLRKKGILTAPEFDLSKEWARQARGLAERFAKPLGYDSLDEFMETCLPQFPDKPTDDEGLVPIPTLVMPRVPEKGLTYERICEIDGVARWYDTNITQDWDADPQHFATPHVPYATWLGLSEPDTAPSTVRTNLLPTVRGGNVSDGVAILRNSPSILEFSYLDLPGSQVGAVSAPYLCLLGGRPVLDHDLVDFRSPKWRSVLAGRTMNLGSLKS